MAPPKSSRPQPDDSRSEASSTKEKAIAPVSNGKGRRVANTAAVGSSLRDVMTVAGSGGTVVGVSGNVNADIGPGLQWSTFSPEILHGYRHDYRLNTPAAFSNPFNQVVLSTSAMGRMSPTMARRKNQRKQGKDQLANAVRKHFNSMAIVENEVVVDFLYKVREQDKNFRMRFTPQRPR